MPAEKYEWASISAKSDQCSLLAILIDWIPYMVCENEDPDRVSGRPVWYIMCWEVFSCDTLQWVKHMIMSQENLPRVKPEGLTSVCASKVRLVIPDGTDEAWGVKTAKPFIRVFTCIACHLYFSFAGYIFYDMQPTTGLPVFAIHKQFSPRSACTTWHSDPILLKCLIYFCSG